MFSLRHLLKPVNNTSLILNTFKSTSSSTMPPSKKSTSKKKASSDKESDNEALKKVKKITKPKNAKEEARLVAKVKEGVNISLFTANKDPKKRFVQSLVVIFKMENSVFLILALKELDLVTSKKPLTRLRYVNAIAEI